MAITPLIGPIHLVEGQVLPGERAWVERMKRRLAGPHAVSKAIAQTAALRRAEGKVGRALQRLASTFKG